MSKRKDPEAVVILISPDLKDAVKTLAPKCLINISHPYLREGPFTFDGASKFTKKNGKLTFEGSGKLIWESPMGTAIYDATWTKNIIAIRQVLKFECLSYCSFEGDYQLKMHDQVIPFAVLETDDRHEPMLVIDQKGLRIAFPIAADHRGDVRTKITSSLHLYLEWEVKSYKRNCSFYPESISHLFGQIVANCRTWIVIVDPEKVILMHIPGNSVCNCDRPVFWRHFENENGKQKLTQTLDAVIERNEGQLTSGILNLENFDTFLKK
jgi:hypothetical protein